MNDLIAYIPIVTTLFSFYFLCKIGVHFMKKRTNYLFWWSLGVFTFGLGTLAESINVLIGWNEANFKFWYIAGALLGGFPLAQGSVYFLLNRTFAHITSITISCIILITAFFVMYSPLTLPPDFNGELTGKVLAWQNIRYVSPFINAYAFLFLVGGAAYSAWAYRKKTKMKKKYIGNIYIALGATLPGIGGAFTRYGHVNVLFVTELLGLMLIYGGYITIRKYKPHASVSVASK